ncbi:MAG: hypothetical protein HOM01_05705 [Kordiimonadaceae bacterium]|nr:hypothetical protein [Kordiimonadaceae bacterium]
MSNKSGAHHSALKINPSLKILLTSGFSQNMERSFNEEDQEVMNISKNMLHKPYNQFELAVAVRNSLDGINVI